MREIGSPVKGHHNGRLRTQAGDGRVDARAEQVGLHEVDAKFSDHPFQFSQICEIEGFRGGEHESMVARVLEGFEEPIPNRNDRKGLEAVRCQAPDELQKDGLGTARTAGVDEMEDAPGGAYGRHAGRLIHPQ